MLRNLPVKHTTEAAIAAAQLLPSLSSAVELLTQPGALEALVAAFLEEHIATDIDTIAGAVISRHDPGCNSRSLLPYASCQSCNTQITESSLMCKIICT